MKTFNTHKLLIASSFALLTSPVARSQDPSIVELKQQKEELATFIPKNENRNISLKEVLEEGLRNNADERLWAFDREIIQLEWEDTYQKFWYPNVSLTLQTDNTQRVGKIKSGNSGDTSPTSRTADGYFGIDMGEYTLFNWGKDYLDYLNDRNDFKKERRNLLESRRNLKHELIAGYFELNLIKEKERIYKEQMRHSSFIYRLGREKANLRKISKQEYYQARNEYLRAREEYEEAKVETALADENFALKIGDKLETRYRLRDRLNFTKLRLSLRDAVASASKYSANLLDAKSELENAKRSYERTLKENLPLPKISVDLGTYAHRFSQNNVDHSYETFSNSKNIEVVASINASWALWGENGFLNSRKTKISHLQKMRAERNFFDTSRSTESSLRTLYREILHYERQLELSKLKVDTAQKNFDVNLEYYMNGKGRFVELKDALLTLRDSEITHETNKYYHLVKKIQLAQNIGLEDFPGESFENLASEPGSKK